MSTVELEDQEWSQVIAIIAQSHPLIAKISTQLVAQRRANGEERVHGRGANLGDAEYNK